MTVMAAPTGARRSELCRSRDDDFDFEQELLLIREKKRAKGKETIRHVPLFGTLGEVMSGWLIQQDCSEYAFPAEQFGPIRSNRAMKYACSWQKSIG